MSVGTIFFFLSALLFFFAGIGVTAIPQPMIWGLFALALGCLLSGVPAPWRRTP